MLPKESIPIELGGKTRYLRYGWGALELIEETFEISILEIGKLLTSQSLKMRDLRNILWAGIAHDEDKDLTQDDIKAMLEGHSIVDLVEIISKAITASFARASDESKKKKTQSPIPEASTKS